MLLNIIEFAALVKKPYATSFIIHLITFFVKFSCVMCPNFVGKYCLNMKKRHNPIEICYIA